MKQTETVQTALEQAGRLLQTKLDIARRLGVSPRLIEKWTQHGVIPALRIGNRLTRYELPRVIDALRAYETKTLNKK